MNWIYLILLINNQNWLQYPMLQNQSHESQLSSRCIGHWTTIQVYKKRRWQITSSIMLDNLHRMMTTKATAQARKASTEHILHRTPISIPKNKHRYSYSCNTNKHVTFNDMVISWQQMTIASTNRQVQVTHSLTHPTIRCLLLAPPLPPSFLAPDQPTWVELSTRAITFANANC